MENQANPQAVKNEVLVHGAFADGSGYRGVYENLTKQGYNVTVVQNPLTSLEDDVTAARLALDAQDGPAILAGHSWGGAVITVAGNHPKVAALVYVAAFQPDNGESALQCLKTAPPAPENGVLPPDANDIVYYDKAKYHAGFGADVPKNLADFMYASQGAFYANGFTTPITHAAWREKPAFACIPQKTRALHRRSSVQCTSAPIQKLQM